MSTKTIRRIRFFLAWILLISVSGCAGTETQATPSQPATPVPIPSPTPSLAPSPTIEPAITPTPKFSRAIDLVNYQSEYGSGWFSETIDSLPETSRSSKATFEILPDPIPNRRDGKISPILVSSYLFLQFGDIGPNDLEEHAHTLRGLYIRSALMSFVDYSGDRVLGWDRRSSKIPMDAKGMIKKANDLNLPVFLEINYSDYIPGPNGSGPEALQAADNIANTISYLESLQAQGLHIEGVTFGDEIGDDAGFGRAKPTLQNSDLVARYIAYATALKRRFPELKIYAFDSYIAATRGNVSDYLELLRQIREAEIREGTLLIDGFVFRESYIYMDEDGNVLDSWLILDDVESLAGQGTVRRYDVFGNKNPNTDRGYLATLIDQTETIFGRELDIGITEYLPAGPVQISESDTSKYKDIDFVIHYADLVGTYAEQGLDVVSTWMFANETDQAKCYIDRQGNRGLNYPIREQLAQYFKGSILQVQRPLPYSSLRVKVYVAKDGEDYFILVLNKDVQNEHTIRLLIPGQYDLTLRLSAHSYNSVIIEQGNVIVSGVGP